VKATRNAEPVIRPYAGTSEWARLATVGRVIGELAGQALGLVGCFFRLVGGLFCLVGELVGSFGSLAGLVRRGAGLVGAPRAWPRCTVRRWPPCAGGWRSSWPCPES